MKESITVIGSSNTDLVVQAPYFPKPGETIMGGVFNTFAGGKGANQAVAAARLGGEVTFVAKVGNDDFGEKAIQGFTKDKIEVGHVYKDDDHSSGVAIIIIDGNGQNSIVVSPGANEYLGVADIQKSSEVIKNSSIVLVQLEIPLKTVKSALDVASNFQKKVILNPAPATQLDEEIYAKTYLITPNETEAEILTGIKVDDEASSSKAADVLLEKGVKNVIITLGDKGAFFKNKDESFHVEAQKVEAVDTTAAGDIFNGALAVALAEGKEWKKAISFANSASAIGVSRLGAQSSAPFRDELKDQMNVV